MPNSLRGHGGTSSIGANRDAPAGDHPAGASRRAYSSRPSPSANLVGMARRGGKMGAAAPRTPPESGSGRTALVGWRGPLDVETVARFEQHLDAYLKDPDQSIL